VLRAADTQLPFWVEFLRQMQLARAPAYRVTLTEEDQAEPRGEGGVPARPFVHWLAM
jgi:hypothetical protein